VFPGIILAPTVHERIRMMAHADEVEIKEALIVTEVFM